MFKKTLIAAAFAIASLAVADTASADHCRYRVSPYSYRAPVGPVISYRTYVPTYRSTYVPSYRPSSFYGAPVYRSYRSYGHPYYRSGTSVSIGRGGVSLYFGR